MLIQSQLGNQAVIKYQEMPFSIKEKNKLSAYKVSIQVARIYYNILGHMNKKIIFTLSNSNHL